MSKSLAYRAAPARVIPIGMTLALLAATLGCRASLPRPVYPLSATPRASFPAMPALPASDGTERLPHVDSITLPNGLAVHAISSPSFAVTTATIALPSTGSDACGGSAARISALALQAALSEQTAGAVQWYAEFSDGFFLVSLYALPLDAGELAELLLRTLSVRPNAEQVTFARERVLRSSATRDLGGPQLALALLEHWRAGIQYEGADAILQVGVREVLGCLKLPPASSVKLAIASNAETVELRAALERVLSPWHDGSEPPPVVGAPRLETTGSRMKVVHRNIEGLFLAAAITGPPRSHPDYFAFSLLAHLFGGAPHGKLQLALRDRLGLTYWTAANVHYLDDQSVLMITTSVDQHRLNGALQALDHELDALQALSGPELEGARRSLRELLIASLERPAESARQLATWACRTDAPVEFMRAWIEALDRLTIKDLQHVARAYFRSAAAAVILVGEKGSLASQLQWNPRKYDLVDEADTWP